MHRLGSCLAVVVTAVQVASGQIQTQVITPRTVVSDIKSFTCGSASVSTLSRDKAALYVPYLASRDGIGECHDIAALSVVPITNPAQTKHYVIAEKGQTICGVASTSLLPFASCLWQGKVRVNLVINEGKMVWRDWDPVTQKVTGEGVYKCSFGGQTREIQPERLTEYLNSQGMTGHNVCREAGDRMLVQTKPVWVDGVMYGFVTSSYSQPILFRCSDGETLEFCSVVPAICEYECQLAYLNGRFYAVMRGAKGDNFFVTDQDSLVFKPAGRVPDGLQRQQMLTYGGRVLIGYSAPDETPTGVRNGRNNLHLLLGEGADLSKYREMMHIQEAIGFVYPDLVDVDGELYVVWSNAERFPTTEKWGAVQGKDQLLFGKIGRLDFDNPPAQITASKSLTVAAAEPSRKTIGWVRPRESSMCTKTTYTPSATDRFVVDFVFNKDVPAGDFASACVWCARDANYGQAMTMFWEAQKKCFTFVCGTSSEGKTAIPVEISAGDRFIIDVDYGKKTVKVNGATYALNATPLTTAGGPLWIFGSRDGDFTNPGSPSVDTYNLRSFKVYAADGTPRLNLVPTYDFETQIASFVDVVSGDFLPVYRQSGDGGSMAWPSYSIDYPELEWVRAVGTQYIDLDYNLTLNDTVEIMVRFERLDADTAFWCARCETWDEAPSMMFTRTSDGNFVVDRGRYQHLTTANPIARYLVPVDGLDTRQRVKLKVKYGHVSDTDTSAFYVNGVVKSTLGKQDWGTTDYPLYLFAVSNQKTISASPFCGGCYRTYLFRVMRGGSVEIDLVPALNAKTGVAGFYDRARQRFFTAKSKSGKDPASLKYKDQGLALLIY